MTKCGAWCRQEKGWRSTFRQKGFIKQNWMRWRPQHVSGLLPVVYKPFFTAVWLTQHLSSQHVLSWTADWKLWTNLAYLGSSKPGSTSTAFYPESSGSFLSMQSHCQLLRPWRERSAATSGDGWCSQRTWAALHSMDTTTNCNCPSYPWVEVVEGSKSQRSGTVQRLKQSNGGQCRGPREDWQEVEDRGSYSGMVLPSSGGSGSSSGVKITWTKFSKGSFPSTQNWSVPVRNWDGELGFSQWRPGAWDSWPVPCSEHKAVLAWKEKEERYLQHYQTSREPKEGCGSERGQNS